MSASSSNPTQRGRSYDWHAHKERIVNDYKNCLSWREIELRNRSHGLKASRRACQNKLKEWGYLARFDERDKRLPISVPQVGQHQQAPGFDQSIHRLRDERPSLIELLQKHLSQEQLEKFAGLFSLQSRDALVLPTLRECCRTNISPDLPCYWCSVKYIHRIAMRGPCMPMDRLQTLVARFRLQINDQDCFGNKPLHFLAASGKADFDHFVSFIEAGADISHRNIYGETFLHVLKPNTVQGQLSELFLYLSSRGFSLDTRDIFGCTALHRLSEHDLLEDIYQKLYQSLDEHGIRRDHRDCFGRTSENVNEGIKRSKYIVKNNLQPRNMTGEPEMVGLVADSWLSEKPAQSPLVLAVSKALCQHQQHDDILANRWKYFDQIQDVIENTNREDDFGNNALHCLFLAYFILEIDLQNTLIYLLRSGIDTNHFNKNGNTPLHTLISLPFPAHDIYVNSYLKIVLNESSHGGHRRVDIEARNFNGRTILFEACVNGRIQCVRTLLSCNANPNVCDFYGHSIPVACKQEVVSFQNWYRNGNCNEFSQNFDIQKHVANISECIKLVKEKADEAPEVFSEWSLRRSRRTYPVSAN